MNFTYKSYQNMLDSLRENDYTVANYHNWRQYDRCVILRHDIDNDLAQAVHLAEVEADKGVHSTWFVLLTSDFYNVFSKRSTDMLKQIANMGHEIGLHFDEVRYIESEDRTVPGTNNSFDPGVLIAHIQEEADILNRVVGCKVDTVSMHRPSKGVLEENLEIPDMINSYSQTFFKEFKYISDSRRRWREPVEEIIDGGGYQRLHILTHAFWYYEEEQDIHDAVEHFINRANHERYQSMRENITDIDSIIQKTEIR